MSDHQMETDYARMFGEITEWVKQGTALSGDYRFERDGILVDIMPQSPAGPFSCLHWKPPTHPSGIVAYLRPERRGASFMGFIDVRGGSKQNWSAQESVDLISALHARISSAAADPALRPAAEHAHPDAEDITDTPAQAAARTWLHEYGINTSRYTDGGGDHPAMNTLPQAFEAFARRNPAAIPDAGDEAQVEVVALARLFKSLWYKCDLSPEEKDVIEFWKFAERRQDGMYLTDAGIEAIALAEDGR